MKKLFVVIAAALLVITGVGATSQVDKKADFTPPITGSVSVK